MIRAVVFAFLVLAQALEAEDHQRVGGAAPAVHRLEAGVDGTFCPLGYAQWEVSVAPRIGYEWQRSWSVSLSQPYSWSSQPEARTVTGAPGLAALGLNWAGGGNDFRWRLGWDGTVPLVSGQETGRSVTLDVSVQWVRDPVILGTIAGVTLPRQDSGLAGQGTLFFQEVVNDTLTWSFVLSPRCQWYDGLPLWSVSLAWKVGWYDGGSSFSSGVSTGTGAPWTWLGSAAQTWDFP